MQHVLMGKKCNWNCGKKYLSYGREISKLRKKYKNLTSIKITFFRIRVGYTISDHMENQMTRN